MTDAGTRPTLSGRIGDVARALLPLGALLLLYAGAQLINAAPARDPHAGVTNLLGFPLRVIEPVTVDQWMFGALPAHWLQTGWRADPSPHWWDAVVALVYVSHFVVIPIITIALWRVDRRLFRRWVTAVLAMTTLGIVLYVVYPMAPPWMASDQGLAPQVARISGLGWDYLGLAFVDTVVGGTQAASNPVAAMPSLHAASAALVMFFCWPLGRWRMRLLVVAYATAMSLVVVYTGEHYVVDVLVGWAVAGIGMGVATFADRRRPSRPSRKPTAAR